MLNGEISACIYAPRNKCVIHMILIRIRDERTKTVDHFCVGFKFENDKHPRRDKFKKQIKSIDKLMTC